MLIFLGMHPNTYLIKKEKSLQTNKQTTDWQTPVAAGHEKFSGEQHWNKAKTANRQQP
jgi:hypothetical protein